jgi:hypothetical protein
MLNDAATEAVARWTDPARRPLFKGRLIDDSNDKGGAPGTPDGPCMCAQGDILIHNGFTPDDLRKMAQARADAVTAELLGISISHAILLRNVNDKDTGNPQDVLTNPENVLGVGASAILALWFHFDRMTAEDWQKARDARAAWAARAARAARDARDAWDARDARAVAFCAVVECSGTKWMPEHETGTFIFLPVFGFADPAAVIASDRAARGLEPL